MQKEDNHSEEREVDQNEVRYKDRTELTPRTKKDVWRNIGPRGLFQFMESFRPVGGVIFLYKKLTEGQ